MSERVGQFITLIINGTPLSDTFGIDSWVLSMIANSIAAFSKIRLDVPIVNPLHGEFEKLKSFTITTFLPQ